MEPVSYGSLSLNELTAIVKDRYQPAQFAVIEPKLPQLKTIARSLPELFERIDEFLADAMMSSGQLDPAHQALIDKRFRTLVNSELKKKFGDDIHLVHNLDEIINSSKTLKEIQVRVQFEISTRKSRR